MIGIIGAMEEEVEALKEAMEIRKTEEVAGMVFCEGVLCGKDAVVVRSGIGKVNAGICAQILVDHFDVDMLINTGIAGSLDARIDIGDMVISTDAVHHDMDATIFGDPAGRFRGWIRWHFRRTACWLRRRKRRMRRQTRRFALLPEGWRAETSLSLLPRRRRGL